MDKCTSIAFTNATCAASPAFRDTHSVVCGSDVLEDAQKSTVVKDGCLTEMRLANIKIYF